MKFITSHTTLAMICFSVIFFLTEASFAQCSMCQKIATDGVNTKTIATSLNHGILYLLALPYFMVAFIFRKQIIGFLRELRTKK